MPESRVAQIANPIPVGSTDVVDWQQVAEWDEKYVFPCTGHQGRVSLHSVEGAEGCYFTLAGGKRIFDFANQLVCVNMGASASEDPAGDPRRDREVRLCVGRTYHRISLARGQAHHGGHGCRRMGRTHPLPVHWHGIRRKHGAVCEVVYGVGATSSLAATTITVGPMLCREPTACGAIAPVSPPAAAILSSMTYRMRLHPTTTTRRRRSAIAVPSTHLSELQDSKGVLACVNATEHVIRTLGPETVAGFLSEPAQGAGMIHPPKEYFPQIREMTQRLGILWLDDEGDDGIRAPRRVVRIRGLRSDTRHHDGGKRSRIIPRFRRAG